MVLTLLCVELIQTMTLLNATIDLVICSSPRQVSKNSSRDTTPSPFRSILWKEWKTVSKNDFLFILYWKQTRISWCSMVRSVRSSGSTGWDKKEEPCINHFLSHFETYARKSKSRHRIERSNIENVFKVLFASVNLNWRQKFSFFSEKNWDLIVKFSDVWFS